MSIAGKYLPEFAYSAAVIDAARKADGSDVTG